MIFNTYFQLTDRSSTECGLVGNSFAHVATRIRDNNFGPFIMTTYFNVRNRPDNNNVLFLFLPRELERETRSEERFFYARFSIVDKWQPQTTQMQTVCV